MLTEYEYEVAESYLRLLSRIGLAVKWDPATKSLSASSSMRKWAITVAYLFFCIFLPVFDGLGLHNLLLAMRNPQNGSGNILDHGFQFVYTFTCPGYIVILLWNVYFWSRLKDNVNTFNQLMVYGRKKGFTPGLTKRAKYLGYYKKLYSITVISAVLATVVGELGVHLPRGNLLVLVLVPWIILYVLVSMAILAVHQIVIYVFLVTCHDELDTPGRTHAIGPSTSTSSGAESDSEGVFAAIRNYKALTILSVLFNGSVCQGFVPVSKYSFCTIAMIVFALSLRIHPSTFGDALVKLCCLILPVYMWGAAVIGASMMSSVWYLAKEHLRDLESHANESGSGSCHLSYKSKKLLLKYVKALNPIRVSIGGLYHMDRNAKCTLMNFIVVGTVNILLILSNN